MENTNTKTIKVFFQKENLLKELERFKSYNWTWSLIDKYYINNLFSYLADIEIIYSEIFNSNDFDLKMKEYAKNNYEKIIIEKGEILKNGLNINDYYKETRDVFIENVNVKEQINLLDEKYFDKIDSGIKKIKYVDYNMETHSEIKQKIADELKPLVWEFMAKCNEENFYHSDMEWGFEGDLEENFKNRGYKINWINLDYEKLNQNFFCLKALQRDVIRYIDNKAKDLREAEAKKSFEDFEGINTLIDTAVIHKKVIDNLLIELEAFIINYAKKNEFILIPEPKQDKPEINKPLNKFTWNDTEENILLLFHFLNQTGLINDKDFENIGSILQDTFLNKKGKPFVNTQINVKKDVLNKVKKLTTNKNFPLIKLSDELKKLIPD